MSEAPFGEFYTTDLAHASVFNTKVRTPGEGLRTAYNAHRVQPATAGDLAHVKVGANLTVDPDGTLHADLSSVTGQFTIHGNEMHTPDFATESGLATHIGHTAADGVHGLWNRLDVSTSATTYYLNQATGNDANNGLSSGAAFQTWAKVESLIPQKLLHNYTIRIVGHYTGDITLFSRNVFDCKLHIRGDSTTPANQIITGAIYVGSCTVGPLNLWDSYQVSLGSPRGIVFEYLRFTGGTNFTATTSLALINCEPRNSRAVYTTCAAIWVENCNFGTRLVAQAIRASANGYILSANNTGVATEYGIVTSFGAIIGTSGTQPTGDLANTFKVGTAVGGV